MQTGDIHMQSSPVQSSLSSFHFFFSLCSLTHSRALLFKEIVLLTEAGWFGLDNKRKKITGEQEEQETDKRKEK